MFIVGKLLQDFIETNYFFIQNKKTKKKTALYVLLNDILRFKDLEEFYQLQHHSFQKRY